MKTENITRTAAIIFSEENKAIKSSTVQRKIIESVFVENSNKPLSLDQIIDELKSSLGMDFDREELTTIINDKKHSGFNVRYDSNSKESYICLEPNRLQTLRQREEENSITPHLKKYINEVYKGTLNQENLEKVLYSYLYELLNKNILTFKKISNPKEKITNPNVDANLFKVEEREAINGFLEWDQKEKNRSLFALISYAIEFSVITNSYESSSFFLTSIKNKIFYLDSNILYRAIGINGENRKNRILTFLDKCLKAGQVLKISKFSEEEFKDTIRHHIKLLQKVPFRRINPKLFSKYNIINDGMYQYYHIWKANRTTYSFDLFASHILAELDNFCKKYKVEYDYKIPFDLSEKKEQEKIETYKSDISLAKKGYGYNQSHYFDAINILLIEKLRGVNKNSIIDTKYFFVSTDQKLRDWDFSRSENQPILLLPSQWMAIILKYYSRTDNDYSSFTSFLKLNTNYPLINEDDLQIILAGISEITEDFKRQETILDKMVELKFNGIINKENNDAETLYNNSTTFSKKQMDSEIENLNKEKEKSEFNFLSQQIKFKEEILKEKKESKSDLIKQKEILDKKVEERFNFYKFKWGLYICAYYILLSIITYKVGWNIMEPITYFFGIGGVMGSLLYCMIYGKDFNPINFFKLKEKEICSTTYQEFGFNISKLETLIQEEPGLIAEIETLKNSQPTH